jgi:hypothetical protein
MGFTPSLIHIVALVCFFLLSPWLVSKWAWSMVLSIVPNPFNETKLH